MYMIKLIKYYYKYEILNVYGQKVWYVLTACNIIVISIITVYQKWISNRSCHSISANNVS